jgi:hypothetical protein
MQVQLPRPAPGERAPDERAGEERSAERSCHRLVQGQDMDWQPVSLSSIDQKAIEVLADFDRLTTELAMLSDRAKRVRAELQFRAVDRLAFGKEHTPCSCSRSCNGDE